MCDDNALNAKENMIKFDYETLWCKLSRQIFCICLVSRKDRFEAASAQFHRYGLCRVAQFYMVIPPTDDECKTSGVISKGRFGIWNSHTNVARLGLHNATDDNVMIWEDDFLFRHEYMSVGRLRQVVDDFYAEVVPRNYDVFKLGQHTRSGEAISCHISNSECQDADVQIQKLSRIYKSDSVLLHCYIWSRKGASILFQTSYVQNIQDNRGQEEDIDSWMIRKQLQMYNCYPQLVVQSGSISSNTGNDTNVLYDRIERVYWPMFGSYMQRKFCDELDWVAFYGSTVVYVLLSIVSLLLMAYMASSINTFTHGLHKENREQEHTQIKLQDTLQKQQQHIEHK